MFELVRARPVRACAPASIEALGALSQGVEFILGEAGPKLLVSAEVAMLPFLEDRPRAVISDLNPGIACSTVMVGGETDLGRKFMATGQLDRLLRCLPKFLNGQGIRKHEHVVCTGQDVPTEDILEHTPGKLRVEAVGLT